MVHFFACAWRFSPAVLLVRVAVHDRSPVSLMDDLRIPDSLDPRG
jgi:hypothetical protein